MAIIILTIPQVQFPKRINVFLPILVVNNPEKNPVTTSSAANKTVSQYDNFYSYVACIKILLE
jgi:hypothetical protein